MVSIPVVAFVSASVQSFVVYRVVVIGYHGLLLHTQGRCLLLFTSSWWLSFLLLWFLRFFYHLTFDSCLSLVCWSRISARLSVSFDLNCDFTSVACKLVMLRLYKIFWLFYKKEVGSCVPRNINIVPQHFILKPLYSLLKQMLLGYEYYQFYKIFLTIFFSKPKTMWLNKKLTDTKQI